MTMNYSPRHNKNTRLVITVTSLCMALTLPIMGIAATTASSFNDTDYTWTMPAVSGNTVAAKSTVKTITTPAAVKPATSKPVSTTTVKPFVDNRINNDNLLVRSIPIDISHYMSQNQLLQQITTPQATYDFITNQKNLLLHMEAIRQAYWLYSRNDIIQSNVLINSLKKRYMANQNDPVAFFDYGYAQLVNDGNKNGLFFLRKANDSLGSSVTSLAYGLAEIDADLVFENASPNDVTPRKMDVGYRLSDALDWNKTQKVAGVWPTFVSIRNAIRTYPGFDRFGHEDFSLRYVPLGKASLASAGFRLFTNPVVQEAQNKPANKLDKRSNRVSQPDAVSALTPNPNAVAQPTAKVSSKSNNDKPNFVSRLFGFGGSKQGNPTPELSPLVKADNLSQVVSSPNFNNNQPVNNNDENRVSSVIPWTLKPDDETPQDLAYAPERVQLNNRIANNDTDNNNVMMLASQPDYAAPAVMSAPIDQQQCEFSPQSYDPKTMRYAAVLQLQGHEPPEAIEFYNADTVKYPYDVRVLNASKHVIGQFTSSKAPFIMEDLNKDGLYELVVRQYFVDPYHPIIVYRWNGSCYSADNTIQQYFE